MQILDGLDMAIALEERRQAEHDRKMERRPCCQNCGSRIWTDTYLKLDGICYCQKCVDDNTGDTAEDFDYEGE